MNVDTISDFLADQRDAAPEELQPLVLEFETLWERKLWHQLTNQLIEFFNNPTSAPQRLQFYNVFVLKFADKINQLKLVDLALKAATQCRSMFNNFSNIRSPLRPPQANTRLKKTTKNASPSWKQSPKK